MSDGSECEAAAPLLTKRRKKTGRITDVSKKLNLQSHSPGLDCKCKRLECFQKVPEAARLIILREFNLLSSVSDQNAYLAGLISVVEIQQRRPRQNDDNAKYHDMSYCYRVRYIDFDSKTVKETQVCYKAFLSIHGIGKKKVEIIQKALKETGIAPKDRRGKHSSRPKKLSNETKNTIMEHIKSFKGRTSHYSLHDSSCLKT